MTQKQSVSKLEMLRRFIAVGFAISFGLLVIWFIWNSDTYSRWFVITMNNAFDFPASSQTMLYVVGMTTAMVGIIILALVAISLVNMRVTRRFNMRLKRAVMLMAFLGWFALLFLFISILLLGEIEGPIFFADISSSLSTEIMGVFLTVLLIDTFGRSWEEWDEESIRSLEGQTAQDTGKSELRQELQHYKQAYIEAERQSHGKLKTVWRILDSKNNPPPAYYRGAISAIDTILDTLPEENLSS